MTTQLEFLRTLFPNIDGEFIEVRLIAPEKPPRCLFFENPSALVEGLPEDWAQYNVFFSACPRVRREGNKAAVQRIPSLWVDLDGKDFKDGKREALAHLQTFSIAPTIIVDSGHGYHAYWKLDHPVVISSSEDVLQVEGYLKGLAGAVNADTSSAEIARVLRLPGTKNVKDPSNPVPVTVVSFNSDRVVPLEEFEFLLRRVPTSSSNAIVKLLKPFWRNGDRNKLEFSLTGFLAKSGVELEEARGIVRELAQRDEEFQKRLATLERTYQRFKGGEPVEGFEGLKEILPKKVLDELEGLVEKNEVPESGKNQASKLFALASGATLFEDDTHQAYVWVPIDGHREVWKCRSDKYQGWLKREFYRKYGNVPDPTTLNSTIGVFEAEAGLQGKTIPLQTRVAWHEGAFWYDLADPAWRALQVTPDGWKIVEEPPILFRRFTHQSPQIVPVTGGDIRDVLPFFNVTGKQAKLLLVYIVSCLVPEIPHPISLFYGEQGSAKSTQHRLIKALLDPSRSPLLSLPADHSQLAQILSHHYLAFFDNLSNLPKGTSDILCRAVTGEGFSKRKLFTDDDDVIFHFQRCLGLNGINAVAEKPDLLERTILFKLPPIPPDHRRDEKTFWKEFNAVLPSLFGAVLTTLSKAMAIFPKVKLDQLPRMADFAIWGCAIAEAVGFSREEFLTAYKENQRAQNEEAMEAHPVAGVLENLLEKKEGWEGTATQLLRELNTCAEMDHINPRTYGWPSHSNKLSQILNTLKTNFRDLGWEIETGGKRREIKIVRITNKTVQIEQHEGEAHDKHDQHDHFHDSRVVRTVPGPPS